MNLTAGFRRKTVACPVSRFRESPDDQHRDTNDPVRLLFIATLWLSRPQNSATSQTGGMGVTPHFGTSLPAPVSGHVY